MLQLQALNDTVLQSLRERGEIGSAWQDMAELERKVNIAMERLREERRVHAERDGGLLRWHERFDRAVRTDAVEHLDRPDFPTADKVRIVQHLHGFNAAVGAYGRFLKVLAPLIHEVAKREGRPARLLELAGGSGEFTLALAAHSVKQGLPVEITGSDYIPAYIEAAREAAGQRGVPARFEVVNAFDMGTLSVGSYDLVFTAQSMHHFAPGQLAMMIAQSRKVATTAFVGIDGERSLWNLVVIPVASSVSFFWPYVADGLTSARKFYSEPELRLIGEVAAPGARIDVQTHHPGHSVLTAHFR